MAYVVSKACGLDPSTRSADYIQLYDGDKEVLMESLDFIQKTATFILTELDTAAAEAKVPHAA